MHISGLKFEVIHSIGHIFWIEEVQTYNHVQLMQQQQEIFVYLKPSPHWQVSYPYNYF
jgi:thiamine pyrophosphokinase